MRGSARFPTLPVETTRLGADLLAMPSQIGGYPRNGEILNLANQPRRRRITWQARLAYAQADFEQVLALWDECDDDIAMRIYQASTAIVAAVTAGNFVKYNEISSYMSQFQSADNDPVTRKHAELALIVPRLSASVFDWAPHWFIRQDLSNLATEIRPIAVANWLNLQMARRNYELVCAVVDNTLNIQDEFCFGVAELQMRIQAAEAAMMLTRQAEAVERTAVALSFAVPAGLLTFFADGYLRIGTLFDAAAPHVPGAEQFLSRARALSPRHSANWITLHTRLSGNVPRQPLLTPRESQVAMLAAEGLQNHEIAQQLGISDGRLRNILSSVYTKLRIHRRSELMENLWGRL